MLETSEAFGTVFVLFAILAAVGQAALFVGCLMAMLIALGKRHWIWFASMMSGCFVALFAGVGDRQWMWLSGFAVTWPIVATIFSTKFEQEQRWVLRLLVGGWLSAIPLLLFLGWVWLTA